MNADLFKAKRPVRGAVQPHFAVALFTLMVVFACCVMMLFVLDQGMQRAIREQEDRAQLLAHTVENVVVRSVQDVVGRLRSIEDAVMLRPDLLTSDTTALNRVLKDLLAQTPALREVTVHGVNGKWVMSSRGRSPRSSVSALQCASAMGSHNPSSFQILTPQPGRYLGDALDTNRITYIPVCVPLQDELGNRVATVTGTVNPDYFHELFRPSHELNPVVVELFDYQGHFLARGEGQQNRLLETDHSRTLFNGRLADAEFGTFTQQVSSTDGGVLDVVSSYRSTSRLPLVVVVHLDLERGLQPWQKESDVIFWIFMALIAAIGVGGTAMVYSLVRKHRMESEIRLLSTAISSTANAVFITDSLGRIQWVNSAFEKLTGWRQAEALDLTPSFLNSKSHDITFFQQLWQRIISGKVWRGQVINITRGGRRIIVDQTITPILDDEGEVSNFIAVHEDVTQRTEAENQARYLAQHDTLTGLPNRHAFSLALDQILNSDNSSQLVVFFVDLDHFKTINDTLGHQAGDEVLRQATQRMLDVLPAGAQLFRLGGDEFSVLIEGALKAEAVKSIVQPLLEQLAKPMQFDESHFTLSGSIGVTFGHSGKSSASVLLKQADMAMYKAKHSGRNTFSFFDEDMNYLMQRHVELEQGMRDALADGSGFRLAYQPVVCAKELKPVSLEVLMRWCNSQGEWVSPAEFIPVAEDIGLILDMGKWQIQHLFDRMGDWQQGELSGLVINLNISPVQLARDDVAGHLIRKLKQHNIPAKQVVVEVTETALMSDSSNVTENLQQLRDCGVRLSIDDFGTGYSSLRYISELDAHVLKIDRSFVSNIGLRKSDEEVIMATVALARNLDMAVVAEGVETAEQMEFLKGLGVDYLQGFYFARPMFEADLLSYIANTQPCNDTLEDVISA